MEHSSSIHFAKMDNQQGIAGKKIFQNICTDANGCIFSCRTQLVDPYQNISNMKSRICKP
jgi:hypothetical protein